MERWIDIVVLLLWSATTWSLWMPGLPMGQGQHRAIVGFGAAALAVELVWSAWSGARAPGLHDALAATAVAIAAAWSGIGHRGQGALGRFLVPASLVALGLAQVSPVSHIAALDETGPSMWLPIHLGLVFAGVGGLALSAGVGALYLVTRARLKSKQFDQIGAGPDLETLDRLMFRAMLFGFVALTLGIAAGGVWASLALDHAVWAADPKVLYTLLLWTWYAAGLQFRVVSGRRGRWTAWFSLIGFGGVLFSMLGLSLLLDGFHARG